VYEHVVLAAQILYRVRTSVTVPIVAKFGVFKSPRALHETATKLAAWANGFELVHGIPRRVLDEDGNAAFEGDGREWATVVGAATYPVCSRQVEEMLAWRKAGEWPHAVLAVGGITSVERARHMLQEGANVALVATASSIRRSPSASAGPPPPPPSPEARAAAGAIVRLTSPAAALARTRRVEGSRDAYSATPRGGHAWYSPCSERTRADDDASDRPDWLPDDEDVGEVQSPSVTEYLTPAPGNGELVAIVQDARTDKGLRDATVEVLTAQDAIVTTIEPNTAGRAPAVRAWPHEEPGAPVLQSSQAPTASASSTGVSAPRPESSRSAPATRSRFASAYSRDSSALRQRDNPVTRVVMGLPGTRTETPVSSAGWCR
jgi:hypothetical protein